jgi:hypothetical protein
VFRFIKYFQSDEKGAFAWGFLDKKYTTQNAVLTEEKLCEIGA